MRSNFRVTCIGDLMWFIARPERDMPRHNSTRVIDYHEATLGGSAINIAEHLAAQGQTAELIAVVGAADQAEILTRLNSKKVDVSGMVAYDGPTNLLIGFIGDRSARSVFVRGKNAARAVSQLADRLRRRSVVVFAGSRDELVRAAVRDCVDRDSCIFVFAPSYSVFECTRDELLMFSKRADIVMLNSREFRFFSQAMGGARQATQLTRCCVVTRSHKGATIYSGRHRWKILSHSGSRIDVIGAGDAFLVGFLVSWLNDRDPFLAGKAGASFAAHFIGLISPTLAGRKN